MRLADAVGFADELAGHDGQEGRIAYVWPSGPVSKQPFCRPEGCEYGSRRLGRRGDAIMDRVAADFRCHLLQSPSRVGRLGDLLGGSAGGCR